MVLVFLFLFRLVEKHKIERNLLKEEHLCLKSIETKNLKIDGFAPGLKTVYGRIPQKSLVWILGFIGLFWPSPFPSPPPSPLTSFKLQNSKQSLLAVGIRITGKLEDFAAGLQDVGEIDEEGFSC